MTPLSSDLRRQLESVVVQARDEAEASARSALAKLAVCAAEPFDHFDAKLRDRRNRLRARGRQVGDVRHANATQSIDLLTQELAYEYWHRMLFARFLAENHLLMHPDGGVAVSLEECKELAPDEGAADEYVLAARYASRMLPQIFRTDDVLLEIEFAPEQRLALERRLAGLPRETFLADDSLGWVYQFWQLKQKDAVNKTGDKIDGTTLPAVTQLFTEHYMVQFLLHNTIGAWWCGRHGITGPAGGAGLASGGCQPPGIPDMEYLRWKDDGTPTAGTFPGWPKTLAEFTALDPCCGSGHFLVSLFQLLVPLRMRDEGLSAAAACDAVLRQNLFGLELDPRCVQIAAFAVALAAWKYPEAGGYRELPPLNIACSGQGVTGRREEWLALANGDNRLRSGMEGLYDLFEKAPHLGSLIDPRREAGDMFTAAYTELQPLLTKALAKHAGNADLQAVGVAARGIALAAELLNRTYTLVATNVPYLLRRKQGEVLTEYGEEAAADSKNDLATMFLTRMQSFGASDGAFALVLPQNWLSLVAYKGLRRRLLDTKKWVAVAKLGPGAFQMISGEVVKSILLIIQNSPPGPTSEFAALDVATCKGANEKSLGLTHNRTEFYAQVIQKQNAGSRIIFGDSQSDSLLESFGSCYNGMTLGDMPRMKFYFWEIVHRSHVWIPLQNTVNSNIDYGGLDSLLRWHGGTGPINDIPGAFRRGEKVWGKRGILISPMGTIHATLYTGAAFDVSTSVYIPKEDAHLPAMWAFCSSTDYHDAVREIDQQLKVTNATLAQVPFDLDYWLEVARTQWPNGHPAPHSDDPTQWLFKGDIATSTDPLQVAVARLVGYRWPEQSAGPDAVDKLADDDGIVCLPGVREEAPAAERLRDVLIAGYGEKWSEAVLTKLLSEAGCKAGATLHDWLSGSFFDQHCKRFAQRPFVWHVWDGRKDGFSALLNYHKLNHQTLGNLTYSYLGDWITAQTAEARAGKVGADLRLAAAQQLQEKLKLILAGEPPYDIFVRWKPLSEQPIGWNPDLNDGVRMNVRPFVEAGVLRKNPNVKWTKDRGNEPQREKAEFPWFWAGDKPNTERVNDVHLTTAEKQAARDRIKAKGGQP